MSRNGKRKAWVVHAHNGSILGEVEAESKEEALMLATRRWRRRGAVAGVVYKPAAEARQRRLEQHLEKNIERFAYHEAGHAVMAYTVGPGVLRVSLKPTVCRQGGRYSPYNDSLGEM